MTFSTLTPAEADRQTSEALMERLLADEDLYHRERLRVQREQEARFLARGDVEESMALLAPVGSVDESDHMDNARQWRRLADRARATSVSPQVR
ncbi:MAG: hypothetical protein ACRDQA_26675 [Nocardioidaceae bacterium]